MLSSETPQIAVLFANPNYRTWIFSRFVCNFARHMQALVVAWQIYELTRSPLALGLIGLAEALPFIAVGLWAGHSADRYEKKFQIEGATLGFFLGAVSFLLLSLRSEPTALPLYAVLCVLGALSSFEFASATSYVQMIIPAKDFPKAAAWNLSQYQFAAISGPVVGGWLLARFSVPVAYAAVGGLFMLSLILAHRLKRLGTIKETAPPVNNWESIQIGLRFVLKEKLILACMVLDMIGVFFGDAIAILPMFAGIFQVGPIGFGILRGAPAAGSLVVSVLQAVKPFIGVSWRSFLISVAIYGVCMIGFGFSPLFWVAAGCLFLSGAADGVGVIIRQSIYQANTPDGLKGRVSSVSSIFIRFSNELGAFESGVAAHFLGAVPSVIFGGVMTLLTVAVMRAKYRFLEKD